MNLKTAFDFNSENIFFSTVSSKSSMLTWNNIKMNLYWRMLRWRALTIMLRKQTCDLCNSEESYTFYIYNLAERFEAWKFTWIIFDISVRTSQETHHVSITKLNRLMLFRETSYWESQSCVNKFILLLFLTSELGGTVLCWASPPGTGCYPLAGNRTQLFRLTSP
jgi:hypothetical protein